MRIDEMYCKHIGASSERNEHILPRSNLWLGGETGWDDIADGFNLLVGVVGEGLASSLHLL